MKIIYVASKYDYGIPERGLSFEHYNFYDTLVGMGHDVEYFDFFTLFHLHGKQRMTEILSERVHDLTPDLMFTFLFSDQFDPVLLKKITAETKTITFNWFADDHWRFDSFSRLWAPCFSYVSTTDVNSVERYRASGYHNVLLTQWGANPRIYKKERQPLTLDVTFVGQAYGNRPAIIREIVRHGTGVGTWGLGWNLRRWHRAAHRLHLLSAASLERIADSTRVTQEDLVKIFQTSKISLNLSSSSTPGTDQIKGRNFEIPACGGFQITGYVDRLEEYFELEKEIVCYSSTAELLEKIPYFLAHESERTAIAEAGYARVLREHTYEQRFRKLFQQMNLEA